MNLERDRDTICAVSTAPGTGGIAVVRVSGSRALKVVRSLGAFVPESAESHRIYFGTLQDTDSCEPLDEVLVSYFAQGRSFTGEEVLEISCHGGEWIAQRVVSLLIKNGSRLAQRGEFTYRAFMNGRIDLVQAEAVLDLIESRSAYAARSAVRQLKGSLSKKLEEVLDELLGVGANLEANIDFAQEDIEVETQSKLLEKLDLVISRIVEINASQSQRRLWDEGYQVTLMGIPNSGKSSLLNAMVGDDLAIVTPIAGTTRDLVRGQMEIGGVLVRIMDTAGLRTTGEEVEQIGISRSHRAGRESDLIFFLIEAGSERESVSELGKIDPKLRDRLVILQSKVDTPELAVPFDDFKNRLLDVVSEAIHPELRVWLGSLKSERFFTVSSNTELGLQAILKMIEFQVRSQISEDSTIAIRARHGELLDRALSALNRGRKLMIESASPEFCAFEIQEAVVALHEVLGRRFDDQIMDRVFGEFCLGK